jgi:hypothetical protein
LAFFTFLGSIPDYPPPSFDEAIAAAAAAASRTAPPLSPADSITTSSSSSPDRYQPAPILIPPVPRPQNQPVVTHTSPDSSLPESVRYSTQAEYEGSDDGDLEFISTSEATSSAGAWDQDRPKRLAREKLQPDLVAVPSSARTVRPSPSQLTLTHHTSETLQDGDDQSISSPSADSQADDPIFGTWDSAPSPVPPKRRLHLLSGLLKSRDNHPASAPSTPTHPAASQLSLPLHFLNRPGSPSKPHRGESLISRKLFGHKGKERNNDMDLETWDMLSDIERDAPNCPDYPTSPAPSVPEHFPSTHGPSDPQSGPLSPDRLREGARPKHHSMLNRPILPPPLPLSSTTQEYATSPSAQTELREPSVPTSVQQQLLASSASLTSPAGPAPPLPPSPSQGPSKQSMKPLLNSQPVVDNPTRGRVLRTTSSMVWNPSRRFSPVPSPTRSAATPTSPATTSLQSGVAGIDYDPGTPAIPIVHDGQEGIFIALPPSPVQEEEEEQFVTPPGSPARSPVTLPLPTLSSRHPSPVRHEGGRIGVTLRDDGPVPPVSPTRSEAHVRAGRTPTITPRPSIGALHAFAPPNPSPLANRPFERPTVISPSMIESVYPPRRDTVVSIGDTESLIELYVHSHGPPAANSSITPADTGDESQQHHYPGRPLPHPPGSSQSGPVQPVLLDLFLAGRNVPAGLPSYTKTTTEKQRSEHSLSSQSKHVSVPASPLVNQPKGYTPPVPLPALLAVLDDEPSEPSSPGSTYEVSPSTPSVMRREFTSLEVLTLRHDDEGEAAATGSNQEARHLSSTPPSYNIADAGTSATTEEDESCAGCRDFYMRRAAEDEDDDTSDGYPAQRERCTSGPYRGGPAAGHPKWARQAQDGVTWRDRGPMYDMQNTVQGWRERRAGYAVPTCVSLTPLCPLPAWVHDSLTQDGLAGFMSGARVAGFPVGTARVRRA